MRLKSIKIVGFKSFVDPTPVPFSSNLSAVVGPNGCGKSNIIDAVRWVMGESSAKHLRGESMADVIFNGSTKRKPVSQASVELVFDNSDGRLGGEYAKYSEIAVKRQVTRDGQSTYFLNGTRCRRKDITHIFLGTGLGARSYAIIEQGMISRLVEAKPDDLRVFLEEAAGISKYKERRREAENRMRHTRDNLTRVNDLQEELTRQLEKLDKQAKAAEQFQSIKAEERQKRAELLVMQWQSVDKTLQSAVYSIRELEVQVESYQAQRTRANAEAERVRSQCQTQMESVSTVQEQYYTLGTELAKVEQSLTHAKERIGQLQADAMQTEQQLQQALIHEQTDANRLKEAQERLDALAPEHEMAEATLEAALESQAEIEEQVQQWTQAWEQFNAHSFQTQQQAEVAQTQITQLEEQLGRLMDRYNRLKLEKNTLDTQVLEEEVEALNTALTEHSTQEAQLESELSDVQQRIKTQREHNNCCVEQLDEHKHQIQQWVGRRSSLEALQEAALGKDQENINAWLSQLNLSAQPRLAQILKVESGWELALETVLSKSLQAVCVDRNDAERLEALQTLEAGQAMLFANEEQFASNCETATMLADLLPLTTKVKGAGSLLAGIFIAQDWQSAYECRAQLQPGQSIVTQTGLWLGKDWVFKRASGDEQDNVLVRQKELEAINQNLEVGTVAVANLEQALLEGRASLNELETIAQEQQSRLKAMHRQISELKSQQAAKQERLDQLLARRKRIEQEFGEIEGQTTEYQQALAKARQSLQETVDQMDDIQSQRTELKSQETELKTGQQQVREQVQQARDRAHQLDLEYKTGAATVASTTQALERLQTQVSELRQRQETLRANITEQEAPQPKWLETREIVLTQRLEVERTLQEARTVLGHLEAELADHNRQRETAEKVLSEQQQQLEAQRLHGSGAQVEKTHFEQQLAEMEANIEEVSQALPHEATVEAWQQALERLKNRISRLGAINLAAIEEFKAAQERKQYLDEQQADIEEALETLEVAIAKIDQETKERFKETFDVVDQGLQVLFPKVFGGGHAYLELTGDDLLETGVAIMARPPGKRNSTIHLLSGGEKALTALSLVFSIFQLNPAPFCMLDEVDAPLDDANVGRFCRLVQEMSRDIQFIYITHNKIAMEMAHRLMGVTMHEPGVSRMVSVDVEEAAQLVGA